MQEPLSLWYDGKEYHTFVARTEVLTFAAILISHMREGNSVNDSM